MTKKEIAVNAVHALKKEYPDAICSLVYTDPLQLLIATRLAAQCTDARVNMVTPSLFDRFKTAQDFADSTPEEVAEYIKSCGLYKTKSKGRQQALVDAVANRMLPAERNPVSPVGKPRAKARAGSGSR